MTMLTKEARQALNTKNDTIMKLAHAIAAEHHDGFSYTVLRQGEIGACIWLEHHTLQDETLRAYVQLLENTAAIGGSINAEPVENASAYIHMLLIAKAMAKAYLKAVDAAAGAGQTA